jgi:hypothetical protein
LIADLNYYADGASNKKPEQDAHRQSACYTASIYFNDDLTPLAFYLPAQANQCAININQPTPPTTKVTAAKMINFCNMSMFFS